MKRTNSNLSNTSKDNKKNDLKFVVVKNNGNKTSTYDKSKKDNKLNTPTNNNSNSSINNNQTNFKNNELKRDINFYLKQSIKPWAEIL